MRRGKAFKYSGGGLDLLSQANDHLVIDIHPPHSPRKRLLKLLLRVAAINRYLDEHNANPKPFVWSKPADTILAKLKRLPVPSV